MIWCGASASGCLGSRGTVVGTRGQRRPSLAIAARWRGEPHPTTVLRGNLPHRRGRCASAVEKTINYAVHDGVHIAYQVVGDGPIDLVYSSGIWSNLEIMWEWPAWARYLNRLANFSRLILFDMRGVGLSDRGPEPPTVELQMDDVGAVMDAAGSQAAVIFGGARGAAMTMLFAASHPERTRGLVLYAPFARSVRAHDWPYGRSEEEQRRFFDRFTTEMGT